MHPFLGSLVFCLLVTQIPRQVGRAARVHRIRWRALADAR